MLTKLSKLTLLMAVSTIGMFAADNTLGTWKRNIEKSTYEQGNRSDNPIVEQMTVREAVPGGVKVTTKGKRKDGTPIDSTMVYKHDGTPTPVTGTGMRGDSVSQKRVDDNTYHVEIRDSKSKYHVKGRNVVSKDGKTMTAKATGTDPEGKPVAYTIVSEKQ